MAAKTAMVVSKKKAVSKIPPQAAEKAKQAGGHPTMDVGLFYAFGQCSLKMEAKHHMKRDFELKDPAAAKVWPEYEKLALRNLGQNEKWVPWHTVLGVHEIFLVREVHAAKVPWWEPKNRFIAMLLFRCTCKMDLFQDIFMPHLVNKAFWKDLSAGFAPGSKLQKEVTAWRKSTGNALQTGCFLIIPERILKDDDANLIHNIMLRSQRLIALGDQLWQMVNDTKTDVNQKYDKIKEAILGVRNLGDTWVKMLMVCIDICLPKLGLLKRRCEVGVGAADPLRRLLVEEGLLAPPPPPKAKVDLGLDKGESEVSVDMSLRAGIAAVKRKGVQLIQVTSGMAGSVDRSHAIAEELKKFAIKKKLQVKDKEVLGARRAQLFADKSLKVPKLGLDAKREELLKNGPSEPRKREGPSPSEALMALGDRMAESKNASAKHFWTLLKEVEAHARSYFRDLPLVVAQMKTQERTISAATLQVQLCEFRQFENYLKRGSGKRPAADADEGDKERRVMRRPAAAA